MAFRIHPVVLAAMVGAVACGSSTDGSVEGAGQLTTSAIRVSVTPSRTAVVVGTSKIFHATVSNTTNTAVNWSVKESNGGAIRADGTYLAPSSTGTFHVIATSVADGTVSASATVQVTLPPPAIPAGAVLVYDDALKGGWQDWSWVRLTLSNAFPVATGTRSIGVFYGPWTGLSFELPGGVAGMGAGTLEFDVNGGSNVAPSINAIVQTAGVWGPEIGVSRFCAGGVIPTDAFTHCSVPLAALQAAGTTFDRIALKEALGKTLAKMEIDEIVILPGATAPVIQAFTANPSGITAGSSATLSATYGGGTAVIDNGVGAIASGGSVVVQPAATTTYTLTVTGSAGQTATRSVTVTVSAPPPPPLPAIQTFSASPATIDAGSSSALSAVYSGGTASIDNGVGAIASGATVSVSPAATTTYTLTVADGAGHVATSSVKVTVVPLPAIQGFTANPASIAAGGSSTLSAVYSGGSGSIDNGAGAIASGATVAVTPPATTTYTLTVTSSTGRTATSSVTVTVAALPAIQSFTANPASLTAGGSSSLTALYTGGAGTIDNGVGAVASGASLRVTPAATTTYTLTVSDGAGHIATARATVTVTAPPAAISVSVTPQSSVIGPSGTLAFSATVSGTTDNRVTWSVTEGAAGGAVDPFGHYTAPAAVGSYHVVATSVADPTRSATATVTVSTLPILSADRRTSWNPGMMAVGGIPVRTTVCATVNASAFGNGTQEASAGIQAAIEACPAGQVVQLSAGTFLTNNYVIVDRPITLRGAGPGATVLKKTNGAQMNLEFPPNQQPNVVIGPNRFPRPDNTTSRNLTADGAKGANSVTVTSATGYAAGQIVLVDELTGASWQPDRLGRGQVWASPDYRVVWQFHNPGQGFDDPLLATTPTSGNAASWFSRQDRVTAEWKEIAGVSGNTVTFTTPLHIDYRVSHTAQITRSTGADAHLEKAGVEDLTVTGGSDGAIRFESAAYSWAKRVEVTIWSGEGFALVNTFRVEVRDSYVHDASWAQPGGAGYAISLSNGSAEALFENNISIMANKVMVARCAGAGSVFGYNYVDDGYINTIEGWIEIGLNASHMVGPHHVLFEGNYGFNWDSDHTHGNSVYHTVFRNQLRCIRKPFTNPLSGHAVDDAAQVGNGPRRCAGATGYSYWMSFIGNVLGAPGQMAGFTYDVTGPGGMGKPAIWLIGWDDVSPQPYDPVTATTTVRHGNFDYLTNTVQWDPGSADHALPDSLYLPGKPAFFSAGSGYAWPWVDPTSATPLRTLPAKARYDAGTPFVQP